MAYTPTEWQSGDIVTSAKLNKIENGIASAGGGGVLVANSDATTYALDKTWQEIKDADFSVVTLDQGGTRLYMYVVSIYINLGTDYTVAVLNFASGTPALINFVATSADGYPVVQQG